MAAGVNAQRAKGVTHVNRIEQTLAALRQMTAAQLREQYLQAFGEPSRTGNRDFLYKRVAWRIQANAEGGLSERAKRRAEELARDADIRTTMPRPPKGESGGAVALPLPPADSSHARLPVAGTVLTRMYRGRQVSVKVLLPDGTFEHEGQQFRSLSSVAKAVTGTHWNGHLFFGLTTVKRKVP
jgi:hypothetical protein